MATRRLRSFAPMHSSPSVRLCAAAAQVRDDDAKTRHIRGIGAADGPLERPAPLVRDEEQVDGVAELDKGKIVDGKLRL